MTDRQQLLERLKQLPANQYDELEFMLDVPESYLPSGNAEPIKKFIALIRYLETKQALPNLEKALNQLLGQPAAKEHSKQVKLQLCKLPHTKAQLFGRETELAELQAAWENPERQHILLLKAFGGTGKTALMQHWLNTFTQENQYQGAVRIYTWSFYSQGSSEDKQASADEFFADALAWFDYQGAELRNAHDQAMQLAALIQQQRCLMLLDGLEPLQYAEGGAMRGELRDKGLSVLFKQLAAGHPGLLVISSRQWLVELQDKPEPAVRQTQLQPLSEAAGIKLFQHAGIQGSEQEFIDTVKEYQGHALSLNLLAEYLKTYEAADIRQRSNLRDLTQFPEENGDSRHAFKVMQAYERQLQGQPELQLLYWLGLFDRPVMQKTLKHLQQADIALPGLNSRLQDPRVFKACCTRLSEQHLLNISQGEMPSSDNPHFDTHPLVRHYFGLRFRAQHPEHWRQAQQALYEYYKALPDKELPDSLDEMQPLFAAIAHGCAAGLHQQALDEVYWPRVKREHEHYLTKKLGAFGADLAAVAHFFATPWHGPAPGLTEYAKALVLNWAAFSLRALGRLAEAVEPFEAFKAKENFKEAAIGASSLSELQLSLGQLKAARDAAEQAMQLADQFKDLFQRMGKLSTLGEALRMDKLSTLGEALHELGDYAASSAAFAQAEAIQQEYLPKFAQLSSLGGFRYCDLLLSRGACLEVQERAKYSIEIAKQNHWLLDISLNQLSLGRASLQQALAAFVATPALRLISPLDASLVGWNRRDTQDSADATESTRGVFHQDCQDHQSQQTAAPKHPATEFWLLLATKDLSEALPALSHTNAENPALPTLQQAGDWLQQAVAGLRVAGVEDHLARGLLARARYYRFALFLAAQPEALALALADLQEVRDSAQRCGMPLILIQYHLEACRLALTTERQVHEQSAAEHWQQAEALINQLGYERRRLELDYLRGVIN